MSELNDIRKIIQEALPSAHPTDAQLYPLCRGFLVDRGNFDTVNSKNESKLLRDFSDSLALSLECLNELHPSVRRSLEHSFTRASKSDTVKFFAGEEPFICFDQLATLLEYIHSGLGSECDSNSGASVIDSTKRFVSALPALSDQQRVNDTWIKVALINAARKVWKELGGHNPPHEASPGPFFNFVADLIEYHGFDWNVEATFRARARLKDRADTWGWKKPPSCK